jgi:hypothetical protein
MDVSGRKRPWPISDILSQKLMEAVRKTIKALMQDNWYSGGNFDAGASEYRVLSTAMFVPKVFFYYYFANLQST